MALGSCQVFDGLKSWLEDVTFHSRSERLVQLMAPDSMFPAQVFFPLAI